MLTLVVSSILDYVHTTPGEFETVGKCDHPVAFVHMEIRAVNIVEICLVLCLSCMWTKSETRQYYYDIGPERARNKIITYYFQINTTFK
jgi:hypothetical protein